MQNHQTTLHIRVLSIRRLYNMELSCPAAHLSSSFYKGEKETVPDEFLGVNFNDLLHPWPPKWMQLAIYFRWSPGGARKKEHSEYNGANSSSHRSIHNQVSSITIRLPFNYWDSKLEALYRSAPPNSFLIRAKLTMIEIPASSFLARAISKRALNRLF